MIKIEKPKRLTGTLERVINEVLDMVEAEGSQQLSDFDVVAVKLIDCYFNLGYKVEDVNRRYIEIQRAISYETFGELKR